MRRGEALGLQWHDIDFEKNEIHVHGQYTSGDHCNEYKETLKTASSYRKLSLDPFVKTELEAAKTSLSQAGRITRYVCEFDSLPSPNAITKRWRTFADKHDLAGVRLHDLRHSSAMLMIQSGVDLNTIKKQLGHSKISTTEIYLHDDFTQSGNAAKQVVMSLFQPSEKATVQIPG